MSNEVDEDELVSRARNTAVQVVEVYRKRIAGLPAGFVVKQCGGKFVNQKDSVAQAHTEALFCEFCLLAESGGYEIKVSGEATHVRDDSPIGSHPVVFVHIRVGRYLGGDPAEIPSRSVQKPESIGAFVAGEYDVDQARFNTAIETELSRL